MHYHNITKDDMRNGDGLRAVLWVAGCGHGCKDCQNPVTWDAKGGLLFDEAARSELFSILEHDYISGVTFSGGDPLYPDNRAEVTTLAVQIKQKFPDKTIWLYTGYLWEQVADLPVMQQVDVLVDGRFEAEQKNINLYWRGSENQRVIDVKATRKENNVVLYCK